MRVGWPDQMARTAARPRPTVVLLVRHGQTPTTGKLLPGRAGGLHLSDTGQAQAKAVGQRLAGVKKIAALYASPLERTRETAAAIAEAVGLTVKVDKGLLEVDIGDWTGQELKTVRKAPEWKQVHSYPSGFRFPGGESFVEMQTRIVSTIERLRTAHPGETIVAVSHADTIKAAVAHALGTHLDLFQRIVISPCSVTSIAYGDGGPTVLSVNSVGDAPAPKES
ncbi:MAG TPA: MSMEG_4193 family putative phosphomutase [Acidimicrobiales bacterium]|nr:MSMEG_4193 family putative phosphomutase [Acidimicrobiales bacterium]